MLSVAKLLGFGELSLALLLLRGGTATLAAPSDMLSLSVLMVLLL